MTHKHHLKKVTSSISPRDLNKFEYSTWQQRQPKIPVVCQTSICTTI